MSVKMYHFSLNFHSQQHKEYLSCYIPQEHKPWRGIFTSAMTLLHSNLFYYITDLHSEREYHISLIYSCSAFQR